MKSTISYDVAVLMDPSDLLIHPPRRHRSLIRRISCWLPLPAATRIHFQEELLRSVRPCQTSLKGLEESSEYLSRNMWYTPTPVTLADIMWLISDEGEDGILLRCQLYGADPVISSTPVSFYAKSKKSAAQCCAHGQSSLDIPTQTPINSLSYSSSFISNTCRRDEMNTPVSTCVTSDEAALQRIRQLENDLMMMRQQLAAITMKQEELNNTSIKDVTASNPPPMSTPTGPPIPPPVVPPPPPPPLPPPPVSTPQMTLKEIIQKNKKTKPNKHIPSRMGNQPDMSEVLKGIGSVKLRSIKRSPGGTPIREKPRASNVNDPAAIISMALKKKFAACHIASPDKENSPGANDFTPSPKRAETPPGPHLLRSRVRCMSRNSPL